MWDRPLTTRLLVRIEDDGEAADGLASQSYSWQFFDSATHDPESETSGKVYWGDLHSLQEALADDDHELWLLVPGARVVTQHLQVTKKEQRHLRQIAPYQLEDELAGEVDDIHFAFGTPVDEQVPIACIDKAWLQGHFDVFSGIGLEVMHCLPDTLMLPRAPGGWTLRLGQELQVCRGAGDGFSVAESLAAMAVASLVAAPVEEDAEATPAPLPDNLTLLAESAEKLERLEAMLPPELAERVGERRLARAWDLDWSRRDTIDLCQGDFARRLPLLRWWQQWQKVGYLAAAVLVAFVLVNVAELQSLKSQQQQLRKAMETVYRQAIPQGAMVDPEKQLAQRAKSSQTQGNSSQLMPMLAAVTPLVATAEGVKLRTMNYNDEKRELRLNIQAPTFNSIEKLRSDLNRNGFTATLINASASGSEHQARLRVERQ